MSIAKLNAITGGLSKPSKMPCFCYSLPASKCRIGSMLRKIKGSVCSKCYACKGRYVFGNVKKCLTKRWRSVMYNPNWVQDMTDLIRAKEKSGYFRWHDSGDLQSVKHLADICQIAINLPYIKFRMPTKEYKILADYLEAGGSIPKNLIIQLSAYHIGQHAIYSVGKVMGSLDLLKKFPTCSTGLENAGFKCPATYGKKHVCGNCRACWSSKLQNVNYKLH